MLFDSQKRAAINSVYQPMSVFFSCANGELFKTEIRIKMAPRLLQEAAAVVGSIHPKLTFNYLEEWLCSFIRTSSEQISPMLYRVRGARESAIEFNSKVIIRLAKHFNIKVSLQQTMANWVDKTTVEVATSIQDYSKRTRLEKPKQTVSVPSEEAEPKITRSRKRGMTRPKQRAGKGILNMPPYDKPAISQGNSNLVTPIESRTISHWILQYHVAFSSRISHSKINPGSAFRMCD